MLNIAKMVSGGRSEVIVSSSLTMRDHGGSGNANLGGFGVAPGYDC